MTRAWVRLAAAALLALLLAGARDAPAMRPTASPNATAAVRGVGLGLFASDPQWDYGPMVDEVRARGATDVLVVVNGFQSTRFAADPALHPQRSPAPATIARTLRQVRAAGMRAALMPVVRLEQRGLGDWRGVIAPADGLDAWFSAYREFIVPLAEIAQRSGAGRFVVGSELGSLEPYERRWRTLIAEVRGSFSGTLLYSANWDRGHAVPFWDALDEVGMTAYFPLQTHGARSPARQTLERAWVTPRLQIDALARRTGKPVLITEVGYPSQRGAAARPWDDTRGTVVDLQLQRRLYGAFCDALTATPSVGGFYVWNWFGYGGPRDAGFTPRGKPAASALSECFARPWSSDPISDPQKGNAS